MISRDSAAGARPHGCGVTGETIGERLARDRQALLPLPPAPYGACDKRPGRVSSLSLLRCRGNDLLRTRGLRPPRGTDPGLCRRGDDQLRGRGDRPAPPVHLAQPDPQPHGRRPRPRQTPPRARRQAPTRPLGSWLWRPSTRPGSPRARLPAGAPKSRPSMRLRSARARGGTRAGRQRAARFGT